MKARLVVERGGKRRVCQVEGPEAVLGRSHGNSVRIPSPAVSRQHCRLLFEDGLIHIEDLDSVNGTFLNGQRIRSREVVRPGDRLEVGPVLFVVEYELTPDALERLRGLDDVELLEALADGSIVESDVMPQIDLEIPVDDEISELEAVQPVDEDEPIQPDFDFDAPWQAPQGDNLRDLLAQMEEDDPEPPPPPPKKKKK